MERRIVLTESMALVRAFQLRDEAGYPNLHLSWYHTAHQEGLAEVLAFQGGAIVKCSYVDVEGGAEIRPENIREFVDLQPKHLGMADEIWGFVGCEPEGTHNYAPPDGPYFMQVGYVFYFRDPQAQEPRMIARVVFAKETQESAWRIIEETVDVSREGVFWSEFIIARDLR